MVVDLAMNIVHEVSEDTGLQVARASSQKAMTAAGERAVDTFVDLFERDFRRIVSEYKTPTRTSNRLDKSRLGEPLKDFAQMSL